MVRLLYGLIFGYPVFVSFEMSARSGFFGGPLQISRIVQVSSSWPFSAGAELVTDCLAVREEWGWHAHKRGTVKYKVKRSPHIVVLDGDPAILEYVRSILEDRFAKPVYRGCQLRGASRNPRRPTCS